MTQSLAQKYYTVAEFIQMPEYHGRYELLDGRLVEKPLPTYEHSTITDNIKDAWKAFDPERKTGMLRSEVAVEIRDDYSPVPDLSFWVAGRVPPLKTPLAARPDLAVEIRSPDQSLKSLKTKAKEYLKAGVRLVWLINPQNETALIFRAGQDTPETIAIAGLLDGGDVIPGFTLVLSKVFTE